MRPTRKLNRRSFLRQVAGGGFAAGAVALDGGQARAGQTGPYTGITDNDSGAYADNAGHGRGPGGNAWGQPPQTTGVTDSDPMDAVGNGRGPIGSGYSDSDSGAYADPSGHGRNRNAQPPQTGVTDSDPTDWSGEGRGTAGARGERPRLVRPDGTPVDYTGITDNDSGDTRDPAGYGRGSRDCRDTDHSQPDWRHRDPVRRCE